MSQQSCAIATILVSACSTIAQVEYTVIDLGIPEGAFEALPNGLNNNGEVVGWSGNSFGPPFYKAWLWSTETGQVTLAQVEYRNGDLNYAATDINDSGVIAGDGKGGNDAASFGQGWRFGSGNYSFVPLLPGDTWSTLTSINAANEVVGLSDDFSPGGLTEDYFFHSNAAGLVIIPESPGQITNIGKLNDQGIVVGTMSGAGPFRWSVEGGFEFLAPPPSPFTSAHAWGINNAGQICGMLLEAAGAQATNKYGAIYTDEAGWQPIADFALAGCCSDPRTERGEAINASSVVAGWSALTGGAISGNHIAWIWSPEKGVRLLDDVVDQSLNIHFRKALDINDAGQIVASGRDNDLPENYRAFLLTPIIEPEFSADLDGDGAVGPADLAQLLAQWGPCPARSCSADIVPPAGGDGIVGPQDLAELLAQWSQ